MEKYTYVKKIVEEKDCVLVTSFEEFELRRESVMNKSYQYVRIDFIGVCGHNSSAVFTNFKSRGTGLRCKECVEKDVSEFHKNRDNLSGNITELNSIKIVIKYLENYYDIVRTKEGCRADLAIKEKNNVSDEWIPVQVKSTETIYHNMYSFKGLKPEYKDMLLLCVCISEEKIWVIPYNELKLNCSTLNISKVSKYNEYGCGNNIILFRYIDLIKDKCMRQTLEECVLPVNDLQQREQAYVQKRIRYLPFLSFEELEIQNTPTDFKVNGKKVQEKVAGYIKMKSAILIEFASNNRKIDGKRQYRTYRLGENDYYWIHSSIDDRFWIIPERVLYEREYITDPDTTSTKSRFTVPIKPDGSYGNNEWVRDYEYDYNSPNVEKITKLFS